MGYYHLEVGQRVKVHTGINLPPIAGNITNMVKEKLYVTLERPADIELSGRITVELDLEEDAAYLFTGRVESVLKLGDTTLVIQEASDIERYQRREFVRVDAGLHVTCYNSKYEHNINGLILNISGNGALISTKEPLKVGDYFKLKFTLPLQTKEPLEFDAEVVREAQEPVEGAPWNNKYGFKFIRISQAQQDRVMSFVFRELTKKGRNKS